MSEEKKEKFKKWAKENEDDIFLCVIAGTFSLAGFMLGFGLKARVDVKNYKKIADFYEEDSRKMLKYILPEANKLYLVERFDDRRGKTYGGWDNMKSLIEETAKTVIELKEEK